MDNETKEKEDNWLASYIFVLVYNVFMCELNLWKSCKYIVTQAMPERMKGSIFTLLITKFPDAPFQQVYNAVEKIVTYTCDEISIKEWMELDRWNNECEVKAVKVFKDALTQIEAASQA